MRRFRDPWIKNPERSNIALAGAGASFERLTTACLAKIETASAKAYMLERWRRWKGLDPETAPASADAKPAGSESKGAGESAEGGEK